MLSWDLRSPERQPLILVSARAYAVTKILHEHQLPEYRRFEELIRRAAGRRAIGTAKKAAYSIATAEGGDVIRGATLAIMQYGVVPVFMRDEQLTVVIEGRPQTVRVAIYPHYRPVAVDNRQLPLQGLETVPERPENFFIARMLRDYLDDCIDKYSRDVSRHFARVVEQSSYAEIFRQIRMIREVLTESLRTKLDTIRHGLNADDGPEQDAIREMYTSLGNAVVRIEVFLFANEELLAAFYEVLGLRIESSKVARRNVARQTQRVQDAVVLEWGKLLGITREHVEHLLGHDPRIAGLKALIDHIRLGTALDDPGSGLTWLASSYEFARRVRYLRLQRVRLHELNVFLSKRSANKDIFGSMFDSPDGVPRYRVHEYSRDTPPANDFYDEIDWLVWACYGFLSIMELSVPADPDDNLAWLVRELDLAVNYDRMPNISIVRSTSLSVARLKQFAGDESVWLFRRPHIQEDARRALLAKRIEGLLQIVHQDAQLGSSLDELRKVVQNIHKVIRDMYVRFAGDFLVGWASMFSNNTLKALEAIYAPGGRPLSSTNVHQTIEVGRNTSIRDIANNVEKYYLDLNGRHFHILTVATLPSPSGSRRLALKASLPQAIPSMFPGASADQVLAYFAAGLPRLSAPKE